MADYADFDVSIEVEHEQVFLGWRGWCFAVGSLTSSRCQAAPGHQQRMSAFRGRVSPEQDVKAQAVDHNHSEAWRSRLGRAMHTWLAGQVS